MRVWKNKRGVIAYLVFAVGLVVQNGPILWAKTEGSGAETDETPILRPMVDGKPGLAMPSGVVEKDLVPPPLDAPPDLPKPPMYNGENGPPNMPPKSDGNKMQPFNSEQMPSPAPPGNMGGVHRRVHGDRPAFGAPKQNAPGMRETRNTKPKTPNPNEADILNVVPQKCVQAKGHFTWNFEEEELISVLRQVSDLLCKTIVVNDSVGKNMKLTIIGKSELSPKDAWDILVASLSAKGLILVQQGKTWTVIKRPELKSYSTPMYSNGKQAQNNEEIGTLFYKVQHTSQDVLRNVAQKLISKDGLVDSVGDQFIIVIDSNSNIRRLGAIFAQVDIKDASSKIQVLEPLLNADVKTVERQLREIFDVAPAGQRARPRRGVPNEPRSALEIEKIIADERTHRLIVVGDKEPVDRLKEAVALLDIAVPDQATKGKIHVRKISHGDAKKIAETLTAVVQQGKSPNRFGRRRDEGTNELFEGEVKITAHENTNMLVTVANANDYRSLLATINQLDVKKPQVYVEAAILDIQVTDNNKFGIDLFSGLNANIPG
ncbi:MAG TPA: secretin N-terminal domain-containing protein, partial [Myxococcota bacterium]|nr:secretin N-terminal domain-containing protein [Myxococcota bacterium]